MLNYGWRGNIRELQNAIERAVLLAKGSSIEMLNIQGQHIASSFAVSAAAQPTTQQYPQPRDSTSVSVTETPRPIVVDPLENLTDLDGKEFFEQIGKLIINKIPNESGENEDVFEKIEYGVVLAALQKAKQNKQAAANLLGVYRPRLYGMIKRHKLGDE
jgi:DNA-binding NtrC family response regulator